MNVKRVLVGAGVVVVVLGLTHIAFPWDVYIAKQAYHRLCAQDSGEKVFETARAESFLLVGEGAGDDGVRLQTAVDDVLERRVRFIEVRKDPGNIHQRNSFIAFLGTDTPSGDIFRVSVESASSDQCLRSDRLPVLRANQKGLLKDNECLRFAVISEPTSRYVVHAFVDEKPVWYTSRVFLTGVRVSDSQTGKLLAQYLWFARVGGRSERHDLACPAGRPPRFHELHRKALFGKA